MIRDGRVCATKYRCWQMSSFFEMGLFCIWAGTVTISCHLSPSPPLKNTSVTGNVTEIYYIRTKKPLQSNDYRGLRVCLVPVAGVVLFSIGAYITEMCVTVSIIVTTDVTTNGYIPTKIHKSKAWLLSLPETLPDKTIALNSSKNVHVSTKVACRYCLGA